MEKWLDELCGPDDEAKAEEKHIWYTERKKWRTEHNQLPITPPVSTPPARSPLTPSQLGEMLKKTEGKLLTSIWDPNPTLAEFPLTPPPPPPEESLGDMVASMLTPPQGAEAAPVLPGRGRGSVSASTGASPALGTTPPGKGKSTPKVPPKQQRAPSQSRREKEKDKDKKPKKPNK